MERRPARERQRRQVLGTRAREQPGIRRLPSHAGVQGCVLARAQQYLGCRSSHLDDHFVPKRLFAASGLRSRRRLLHGELSMNVTRTARLLALAASFALSACGGSGAPTTATPGAAPTSTTNAYTGPAPATADVQAF